MRAAFFGALCEEAQRNPNIWLLTGDVGFGFVEPFQERFPDRFINCGIMEQTMMGVATGLALSGKTVFVYSISTFPTLRCLEQIRNDVIHHNADVKIVMYGAGNCYPTLGFSHSVTEDEDIMVALGISTMTPCNETEVGMAVRNMPAGPFYLRLGKAHA